MTDYEGHEPALTLKYFSRTEKAQRLEKVPANNTGHLAAFLTGNSHGESIEAAGCAASDWTVQDGEVQPAHIPGSGSTGGGNQRGSGERELLGLPVRRIAATGAAAAGRGVATSLGQGSLVSALSAGRAGLVLVVSLKVLLHVVGAGEFLLAARVGALNSLLSSVDFRVARCVSRGGEGFLAAMAFPVSARVSLAGTLRQGRGSRRVVLKGIRATAVGVSRTLGRRRVRSVFMAHRIEGSARVGEVDGRSQRRDGIIAHLGVV